MGGLKSVLAIVCCLFVFGATSSFADDHDRAKRLLDAGEIISAEKLLTDAMQRKPGRLLEFELEEEGGRYVYEVEIIDDAGVVWGFYYDARNGDFLRQAIED